MAIKMRVLHKGKGKIPALASAIHQEFQLNVNAIDTILPAYPLNRERLTILLLSTKGEFEEKITRFFREFDKEHTQNVALVIDGTEAAAKKVKDLLTAAGTNVIDDVLYLKNGLFNSRLKDEEKEAGIAWAKQIVDGLQ